MSKSVFVTKFALANLASKNPAAKLLNSGVVFFFFNFFNCYLADPRSTLGHSQGDSLANPMLITAFLVNSTRRSPGAS